MAETLRVLIADEHLANLEHVADVVRAAGHEVLARSVSIPETGAIARQEEPDLAIVALGEDPDHALDLIAHLVEEADCPVLVAMDGADPTFAERAAAVGVFGQLTGRDPAELEASIEIALRRYEEYGRLEAAFFRRAVVERAKGILMERHHLDERKAFELLRGEARRRAVRVVEIAEAVLAAHPLLPADADSQTA